MSGGRQQSSRRSRHDWGWHPLRPEWARRIVAASDVDRDTVVDIGAGTGALVDPLLNAGARVIAVELNARRAAILRERYAARSVVVVRADLAQLRWPRRPFRVVASPPYNLTSVLVRRLLSLDRLQGADLVLQRSAARRLVAEPPGRHARRYSLALGMTVPRRAFVPAPKVDSVVLRIRRR